MFWPLLRPTMLLGILMEPNFYRSPLRMLICDNYNLQLIRVIKLLLYGGSVNNTKEI